ncbi:kinase-like protein [Karstenula rhodostoma CBS 690.94]|uniref:Kinase-like protein n=1 Tax=Karstenula rhodostoma CBS 690.94 TaxID=1392251 RepID=A0A9P4PFX9_9PLEO|nr:kinase-like protein [Karstenula rhodostoma CBS 690.94]
MWVDIIDDNDDVPLSPIQESLTPTSAAADIQSHPTANNTSLEPYFAPQSIKNGFDLDTPQALSIFKRPRRPLDPNLPGAFSPASYVSARSTFSSYRTAPSTFTGSGPTGFPSSPIGHGERKPQTPSRIMGATASPDRKIVYRDGNAWQKLEVMPSSPVFSSEWLEHLRERGVLLDTEHELNWSGRGQHIEYEASEADQIPLQVEKVLGYSGTALVESVMCRRIRLARKTVRCSRRLTKKEAIVEVEHLQRLSYSHLVRVVGTYTLKQDLSILLYPAADQNLEQYMDDIDMPAPHDDVDVRYTYLETFMECLVSTILFLHNQNIKHMDIKPKNILVRHLGSDRGYKVYLADFGIARAYSTAAEADTESPVPYTRTYAAPEVIMQERRSFSADIFSLGCVFIEMVATLRSYGKFGKDMRAELRKLRFNDTDDDLADSSYQNHIDEIKYWLKSKGARYNGLGGEVSISITRLFAQMIDQSPDARPRAEEVMSCLKDLSCVSCDDGTEPFEAVRPWVR